MLIASLKHKSHNGTEKPSPSKVFHSFFKKEYAPVYLYMDESRNLVLVQTWLTEHPGTARPYHQREVLTPSGSGWLDDELWSIVKRAATGRIMIQGTGYAFKRTTFK